MDQETYEKAENLLLNPPKGTWVKNNIEKLIIGVSVQDVMALFVIFFAFLLLGLCFIAVVTEIGRPEYALIWILGIVLLVYIIKKVIFSSFGKIELVFIDNKRSYLFISIGTIGKKYDINWKSINRIYVTKSIIEDNILKKEIIIEGEKTIIIPLGSIDETKVNFLLSILQYYKHKLMKQL